SVMHKYIKDSLGEKDNAILGLGGLLAGFAFEKSGNADEALRYYDEALEFGHGGGIEDAVSRLLSQGSYTSPRLKSLAGDGDPNPPPGETGEGETLFVVGYGRVPHKIPQRTPIGLALTSVAHDISPADHAQANRLAAQGLVTWVNFPTLERERGAW